MDRLEERTTQGTQGTERTSSRRLAVTGTALLAVSGLTALTLTGCPSSPTNNEADMGSVSDMGSSTDMNTVRPQQPGCSKDEWCWLYPQPQGNTLWTVWGSSPDNAWAAGESGTLVHYTGGQWKAELSPTKSPLYALWGSAANDIYAVGDRGTVLHYDGQAWSAMPISGSTTGIGALYAVWGSGKDDVWIVGAGGVILRKSGATLSRVQTPMDPAYQVLLKGVWGMGSTVYAVGAAGSLLKYDGTSWSASTVPGAMNEILTSISGTAANNLFVSSLSGAIRRFDGTNWTTVSPFGNFGIYSLWASGSDVFAVGDVLYTDTATKDLTKRQGIVKKWNGTAFADVAGSKPISLYAIWGTSASDLVMVGASGTIVRYNGSSFTSSSQIDELTGISAPLNAISGSGADNLVTVGDWGATLKWDGSRWSSVANSVYLRFRGLSGPTDNLWSVALDTTPITGGPRILQWQGGAWSSSGINLPAMYNNELQAIWVSGGEGIAVGRRDSILRRSGANWNQVIGFTRTDTILRAVWGSDIQNVWIVGGGQEGPSGEIFSGYPGKILFYNGSSIIESLVLPESDQALRAVWGAGKNDVWAVGDNGLILKYNGTQWSRVDSGTQFGLRGIWGTAANNVYAVGIGGTVLRYDGQAWKRQDSGTGISLIGVFGAGKDVFAVGYSGAILRKIAQ
jgi:hypothetical protein